MSDANLARIDMMWFLVILAAGFWIYYKICCFVCKIIKKIGGDR